MESSRAEHLAPGVGPIPHMPFHALPELGVPVANQAGVRIAICIVDQHAPQAPDALDSDFEQFDPVPGRHLFNHNRAGDYPSAFQYIPKI